MIIKSHKGEYEVHFTRNGEYNKKIMMDPKVFTIVDEKVKELWKIPYGQHITIEATEDNKSLEKIPGYIQQLVKLGCKRDCTLLAIGGGIIQDITCFIAATFMRGVPWIFIPTTLLAQCDSCIGSKSSINCMGIKNVVGTFTPPKEIHVDNSFFLTLSETEMKSGMGEMLKVHSIAGPGDFKDISENYIIENSSTLKRFIKRSLEIKKTLIELDEFDKGPRNIMNYGHTFGHAIESATNYTIPHGIAVSIGCNMANFVSSKLGLCDVYEERRITFEKNYEGYDLKVINFNKFYKAISNDKKNTGNKFTLILPTQNSAITINKLDKTDKLKSIMAEFLK